MLTLSIARKRCRFGRRQQRQQQQQRSASRERQAQRKRRLHAKISISHVKWRRKGEKRRVFFNAPYIKNEEHHASPPII